MDYLHSNTRRTIAVMACAMLALAACDDDDDDLDSGTPVVDAGGDASVPQDAAVTDTIVDIALADPELSVLVAAATRADMMASLAATELTLFAPTNDAWAASGITMAMIDAMSDAELRSLLEYHTIPGTLRASDLEPGPVTTLSLASLLLTPNGTVTINGGNTVVGGADVVGGDIPAVNGVVHVIDRVLVPPTVADLARYAGLSRLSAGLTNTGLETELAGEGPFTLFAPTDAAFDALSAVPVGPELRRTLMYHVVDGRLAASAVPNQAGSIARNDYDDFLTLLFDTTDGVRINDQASVVTTDIFATNGVMHIIDQVLVPMNAIAAATAANLTGLLGAIANAADLTDGRSMVELLSVQAPYTIFAPTNDAFTAAAATTAGLTDAELRDVLLFHVLNPTISAFPVTEADLPTVTTELETLEPNPVNTLTFEPGPPPTVEGAEIVATDIVVTNGVIHLIDEVMIPPAL